MGWDYLKSFAWADFSTFSLSSLGSVVSDLNELLRAVNELTRVNSDAERVAWISRNYKNVLAVSKSLFGKLLKVFRQGPIKEIVEIMWKEVEEGDFLRDCLELGTNDLKGLIQIIKEIALQYGGSAGSSLKLIARSFALSSSSWKLPCNECTK